MQPQQTVNVVIGIQARSTSRRFPGKVFALLGHKPVLQHVIDSAVGASLYLNNYGGLNGFKVVTALAIPTGDRIKQDFARSKCTIVEGPEFDVLERYRIMAEKLKADYIVRITGDCPLIPSPLITKHIKSAMKNKYDYISNVDERVRVSFDGTDCEVFSRRLLEHTCETVVENADREHVTTLMRRNPPDWAKIGHIIGYLPMADLKLSVDTPEDLERVRREYDKIQTAIGLAERMHGKTNLHRF